MVRWRIVQTPWLGLCLHRLDQPDQRTTLHDHPWPFLSFVLRGGYTEEFGRTTGFAYVSTSPREGRVKERITRTWRARSIHRCAPATPTPSPKLHRSPTWTLVLTGPRAPEPSWGYWDENGWTAWDKHDYTGQFEAARAAHQAWVASVTSDPRFQAGRDLCRIAVGLLLGTLTGLVVAVSRGAWGWAAMELGAAALAVWLIRRARRKIRAAERDARCPRPLTTCRTSTTIMSWRSWIATSGHSSTGTSAKSAGPAGCIG